MARHIEATVGLAYYAVNVRVTYSTKHAFSVKKDVLPTLQRSNLIYEFECRHCGSRYVGRTQHRLNARVKQHVPLHMLTDGAKVHRPTRGRPRKDGTRRVGVDLTQTGERSERRRGPPRKCKVVRDDIVVAPPPKVMNVDQHQSSIARHLAENVECAVSYDDTTFRPLAYGRSKRHLEVLEAVFIALRRPDLCAQKQNVTALRLFHMHAPS